MFISIHPKLPMRNRDHTKEFYTQMLGFVDVSASTYENYLILSKDGIELHFFLFKGLDPLQNYGQVYIRVEDIDKIYSLYLVKQDVIHPNGKLEIKPWGQKEFSVLDDDGNLLTFGQAMH